MRPFSCPSSARGLALGAGFATGGDESVAFGEVIPQGSRPDSDTGEDSVYSELVNDLRVKAVAGGEEAPGNVFPGFLGLGVCFHSPAIRVNSWASVATPHPIPVLALPGMWSRLREGQDSGNGSKRASGDPGAI